MALDHYIPQTYLSQFIVEELGSRIFVVRKSDQSTFGAHPKDLCRGDEHNTNKHLLHQRAIEVVLKEIEPHYRQAVNNFRCGKIAANDVFVISGLITSISICSPKGRSLQSGTLRASVEGLIRAGDANGEFPPPPKSLGAASLSEVIENGTIELDIDPRFPQAVGTTNFRELATRFGNAHWEILKTDAKVAPFISSDFPTGFELSPDPRVQNRIFPLAPDIAVRINLNIHERGNTELRFDKFSFAYKKINKDTVRAFNRSVVWCADKLIFCSTNEEWVVRFVRNHRNRKLDTLVDRIPTDEGEYIITRQRVVPT